MIIQPRNILNSKGIYYGLFIFFSEETKTWTAAMDHKPSSIWTYQNAIRKNQLISTTVFLVPTFLGPWRLKPQLCRSFALPVPVDAQRHESLCRWPGVEPTGSTEDKKPTEVGKMWEIWGGCLDDHPCLTDVVNTHGDRFRPLRIDLGLWGPLPNGLFLACKWGWS